MLHKPLESSMIVSVGYEDSVLEVEFKNGRRYQYKDVPPELVDQFLNADSPGRFFGQNIRGKFEFQDD